MVGPITGATAATVHADDEDRQHENSRISVPGNAKSVARELPEQRSELIDNGFDADADHVEHGPGVDSVG
jgi:hypothetical protein